MFLCFQACLTVRCWHCRSAFWSNKEDMPWMIASLILLRNIIAVKKTWNTIKNLIYHQKLDIPVRRWYSRKNMIFQEKHGIPSISPCYCTNKVGISGKRWDSRKKMGFKENHGFPAKTWNTSKKMIFDKKVAGDPIYKEDQLSTDCMAAWSTSKLH